MSIVPSAPPSGHTIEDLILEQSSLPKSLDIFRLNDFLTAVIASECFVETSRRLGYEQDLVFRELPLR